MDEPWHIELLGRLRATQADHVVSRFSTQKTGALLAYLAFYRRPHPREFLLDLLWPECDRIAGRHRLAQVLYSLRCQLEPPGVPRGIVIVANHTTIQLNPVACTTDVSQFESDLEAARRAPNTSERLRFITRALSWYGGELLPGHFEGWILPERQHLADAYIQALHALIALTVPNDPVQSVLWARQAVAADPLREESHRELIRLLIAGGQPEAARRQLEELTRLLAEELRTEPAPETLSLMADLTSSGGFPARSMDPEIAQPGLPGSPDSAAPAAALNAGLAGSRTTVAAPQTEPSGAPAPKPTGALPLQFTRFFGREREIVHLCHQLTSAVCRFVTLTGSGGVGKSRLAVQAAEQLRGEFPGGVWFVPLLDLVDPSLILDQIRDRLRLARVPNAEPLEHLAGYLSRRPALLLLDNFEHLVEGGAEVVRLLLERVESLRVLITSRQTLGLEGEQEFLVQPLPVPDQQERPAPDPSSRERAIGTAALEELLAYPSVALFVSRAQAVRPDFQLTRGNAAAVISLCVELEGLPLAIELAAARSGVLTPHQMLTRLACRFELLASGRRLADPRHRSLRATLDWSYQLLSPKLQQLFRRLAVFRGGWTLEAAEVVCEEPGALELLDQLRSSSLIFAGPSSDFQRSAAHAHGQTQVADPPAMMSGGGETEMRCRFLETVREFAWERLTESGEAGEIRRRHRDCYVGLAEEAEPQLYGPAQKEWLVRLERETENLRAALAWCRGEPEGAESGLRLAGSLTPFWNMRSHHKEGLEHLQAALAYEGAAGRTALRAKAADRAGFLAYILAHHELARSFLGESLEIWRELGDRGGEAGVLSTLGLMAAAQALPEEARAFYERALAVHRELGHRVMEANNLRNLGSLAQGQGDYAQARFYTEQSLRINRKIGHRVAEPGDLINLGCIAIEEGDYQRARSLHEQALAINREVGNRAWEAHGLSNLGHIARKQGDYARALSCSEQALAISREIGRRWEEAKSLQNMGLVANEMGEYGQARSLLIQALEIWFHWGDMRTTAETLEALASVAAAQRQPHRAARLYGAAAALRETAQLPLPPGDRDEYAARLAAARAVLSDEAFAAAWSEGEALALDQAILLALAAR